MVRFLVGLLIGVVVGMSAGAYAASFVGNNGYLYGWAVLIGGHEVCFDPHNSVSTRAIECD